jgi:hypothetical protein
MKSGCLTSEISLSQNLPESLTKRKCGNRDRQNWWGLILMHVAAFGGADAMLVVTDHYAVV